MPDIQTVPFEDSEITKLKQNPHTKDWPVVYFLENGSEAYIGETTGAHRRFKEHYKKTERQKLKQAHIIVDEEFNKSATLDIESWLIQYLVADNKFKLQNGNSGLANHSYFDREKYRAKFEIIWSMLQSKGLAHKDLIQLRNSDVFKYSPYKSLTDEQIAIVDEIKDMLANQDRTSFIINGGAGTGKSVLAVFLTKYLSEFHETKDLRVGLVISMSSLRKTLKKVFSKIKGLNAGMVIGPNEVMGQEFDLLIVDEAHRLKRRVNLQSYPQYDKVNKYYSLDDNGTQLDWVLRASRSQVFLYDREQSVTPGDIRPEDFERLDAKHYKLNSQLRALGGNDYIQFIDDLLALHPTNEASFENYDFRYFSNLNEMIETIKSRDRERGLSRLVAGYAWTWQTKNATDIDYDIELDGLKLKWNSKNIDWVNSENAINEVGCVHTVQGYDLNYVGVIIGPELSYDPVEHRLVIDRKKYKDFNGSRSLESPEELERYIINIYKTLLTRGIYGTYIHAVDENLADYIKSKIVRYED